MAFQKIKRSLAGVLQGTLVLFVLLGQGVRRRLWRARPGSVGRGPTEERPQEGPP